MPRIRPYKSVSRIAPHYAISTINPEEPSAFPETTERYRANFLWPFFEVRIPPTSRSDVREVMEAEKIDGSDPFEMLATLGRLLVANSYEMRLLGES